MEPDGKSSRGYEYPNQQFYYCDTIYDHSTFQHLKDPFP